jgi:hypothetical protein
MKNFDFYTYDTLKRHFTNEIEMRNQYFRKYIEMWIEEYIGNSNYSKSFEYEVVWRYWNEFEMSVFDFINRYKELLKSENESLRKQHEIFENDFLRWRTPWIKSRRKDKNGDWIDSSSMFQTLVRKVMKEQNFVRRLNYFSEGGV